MRPSLLVAWFCALLASPLAARADTAPPAANVQLGDATVFELHAGDLTQTLEERARATSQRLNDAAARPDPGEVTWQLHGADAVVSLGIVPIVTLHAEDAELAHEPSLSALAQRIAASVQSSVERERERAAVAHGVFAISLVVFLGLVVLYLGRRLSEWTRRGRHYLGGRGRDMPALRLRGLEVLGPVALRGALLLLLSFARWFGALGLGYLWLVVTLSMFDDTRPYVERITGLVLAPLSALAGRVATSLPVFVVVAVASLLVAVLVRTTEIFFSAIARGDSSVDWLSPTAAPAVSVLARVGIAVGSAVFVAPVLTGDPDGSVSRSAFLLLAAIALGSVPFVVSLFAGLTLVLSQSVRVGDHVEYGGRTGTVRDLGVFALALVDEAGALVRVPHLMALWHVTRILPRGPA